MQLTAILRDATILRDAIEHSDYSCAAEMAKKIERDMREARAELAECAKHVAKWDSIILSMKGVCNG